MRRAMIATVEQDLAPVTAVHLIKEEKVMAKPTEKNPDIENFLNRILGDNRKASITTNLCVAPPIGCGGPATEFRDELSEKEYRISGLCQTCQDSIFGE